jgi:hypothetical protein
MTLTAALAVGLPNDGCAVSTLRVGLAAIRVRREAAGLPIAVPDVMIAATALAHGATVATRNVGNFPIVVSLSTIHGTGHEPAAGPDGHPADHIARAVGHTATTRLCSTPIRRLNNWRSR